jgi:hypothetical protein
MYRPRISSSDSSEQTGSTSSWAVKLLMIRNFRVADDKFPIPTSLLDYRLDQTRSV